MRFINQLVVRLFVVEVHIALDLKIVGYAGAGYTKIPAIELKLQLQSKNIVGCSRSKLNFLSWDVHEFTNN